MPPHEHDNDAVSPFRPSHVHEPWSYVCASRCSRPRPYVCTWPYFLSCTLAAVRTCTCYVRASTTTRARLYYDTCAPLHRPVYNVRDQNDNAMYASTRWVPSVRHFLACEDVAGGSQQTGGRIVVVSDALPCVRKCSWWVPADRGKHFFAKYGGPSGGSPLSGGGIVILRVTRRHLLAAAVDPAVSLSTYSPRPMEAIP